MQIEIEAGINNNNNNASYNIKSTKQPHRVAVRAMAANPAGREVRGEANGNEKNEIEWLNDWMS